MSNNSFYAREKALHAIQTMAVSPDSIQERIGKAYMYHLDYINPDRDLKPALHSLYEEISSQLTSGTPEGDEGTIQATVNKMTENEATEIAQKILHLCDEITV